MTTLVTESGNVLDYTISGEGEPVLLICGAAATQATYETGTAQAFRGAGYSTITFDLRGMGLSAGEPEPYLISDLVADTIDLLDHLDRPPMRVFGISTGAMIGQELALARPDRVHSLTLVSTIGRQGVFMRANYEVTLADIRGEAPLPPDARDLLMAATLFSPRTLCNDEVASTLLHLSSSGALDHGLGFVRQLEALLRYDDRLGDLQEVRTATLVIAYGDDLCTPPGLGQEVADAIPNSRFLKIDDAGHLGSMEKGEETMAATLAFFAEV